MSMDELDSRIVLLIADSGEDFITAYQVTAGLYPTLGSEGISALRPKIRNRITKLEPFEFMESIKENGVRKYRLKDGAFVTTGVSLQVPIPEEDPIIVDAGPVLITPVGEEYAAFFLNSWVR